MSTTSRQRWLPSSFYSLRSVRLSSACICCPRISVLSLFSSLLTLCSLSPLAAQPRKVYTRVWYIDSYQGQELQQ
jgi:hypothetical protein